MSINNLSLDLVTDEVKRRIKEYKKVSISNTYSLVRRDELETLLEFIKNV